METGWFIAPYKRRAGMRPARYCALDDLTPVIAGAGGQWEEGEVLGGYAVARVTAPESALRHTVLRQAARLPGVIALPAGMTLTTSLGELDGPERRILGQLALEMGYTPAEMAGIDLDRARLVEYFMFIGQRRRKARYDAGRDAIVLDGAAQPVTAVWTPRGGAFPTTGVLDPFNRGDSSTLGASWTAPVYVGDGDLEVSSNQARAAAAYEYCDDYWNVSSPGPDSEAYVTLATLPGTDNIIYLFARLQSPGTSGLDGYEVDYAQRSGTDQVYVYRIDDATFTQLGATVNQEFSAGDGLGMEVIGSTIRALRRSGGTWAELASRTDSTYASAGRIGFGIRNTTGRVDDFGGGTVVATPALEQEGFRFRNDDGNEAGASWRQSQDVNDSIATQTRFRLRVLVNASGDPDPAQLQVEYRRQGDPEAAWRRITPQ